MTKAAEVGLAGVLVVALVFGLGQQFAGGVGVTCPGVRTCVAPGMTGVVAWVPVGAAVLVGLVAVVLVADAARGRLAANTDKPEGES